MLMRCGQRVQAYKDNTLLFIQTKASRDLLRLYKESANSHRKSIGQYKKHQVLYTDILPYIGGVN